MKQKSEDDRAAYEHPDDCETHASNIVSFDLAVGVVRALSLRGDSCQSFLDTRGIPLFQAGNELLDTSGGRSDRGEQTCMFRIAQHTVCKPVMNSRIMIVCECVELAIVVKDLAQECA